jgi:hypothetical protein
MTQGEDIAQRAVVRAHAELAELFAQFEGETFGQAQQTFVQNILSLAGPSKGSEEPSDVAYAPAAHAFIRSIAEATEAFMDALVAQGCFPNMALVRPYRSEQAGLRVENADGSVLFEGERPIGTATAEELGRTPRYSL